MSTSKVKTTIPTSLCNFCGKLPKTPSRMMTCCQKQCCMDCIQSFSTKGQSCPICNSNKSGFCMLKMDRPNRSLLMNCTNEDLGCKWSGKMSELFSHLEKKCQFVTKKRLAQECHLNKSLPNISKVCGKCTCIIIQTIKIFAGMFVGR